MTLLSLLTELVDRDPKAVITVDADHLGGALKTTREHFLHRVWALEADLSAAGVERGDCVAVWLPNWSDALCWQFAAIARGAVVVGINTRYQVDDVAHVLDHAQPKVVAVAHNFHGLDLRDRLHQAVRQSTVRAPSIAVVSGPGVTQAPDLSTYDVGAGAWEQRPATSSPGFRSYEPDGSDLAVAFTTSGSTGKPKLAAHRESSVEEHAVAVAKRMNTGAGDVVGCILPLSGVFGYSAAMAGLIGGAACLLEPVFDEDLVIQDMAQYRVTHIAGGDDMIGRLEQAWRNQARNLSSWRWLGLADLVGRSQDLAGWAESEFGTVVTGIYGSSEVFALTAFWPADEPKERRWLGGGVLSSTNIYARAADPLTGDVLAPGEEGELQLLGYNVVDSYLGNPDAYRRAFTADSWFRTGDLGQINSDGSITYVCRMGDELRLRGFLVAPAEIEYRLIKHEAVEISKVVGIRSESGETLAVGYVVLKAGVTIDGGTLRQWCAEGLAKFKVPSAIHVVDRLPMTTGTNGSKIRAKTLREWAQKDYDKTHGARKEPLT